MTEKNTDDHNKELEGAESITQATPTETTPETTKKTKEDELKELSDKYLRTLAELENLKKFSAKQIQETASFAINNFARELLGVLDIFSKAISSIDESTITSENFKAFVEGIKLTQADLYKTLNKFGVEKMGDNLISQKFDPNYHEVVTFKADSNLEDNSIFAVFEAGFVIKGKLLRAAKVGIVKNS